MSPSLFLLFWSLLQPAMGTLVVQTEPGAEFRWEGVSLGRADDRGIMEIQRIPPGSYRVSVSKDGFAGFQGLLEIREGVEELSLTLQPVRSETEAGRVPEVAAPAVTEPVSVPEERELERSSALAGETGGGIPLLWYLLVGAVLCWVMYRLVRFRGPVMGTVEGAGNEPAWEDSEDVLFQPSPVEESTVQLAFLQDLSAREKLADGGVEVIPPERNNPIDLDPEDVREVEE